MITVTTPCKKKHQINHCLKVSFSRLLGNNEQIFQDHPMSRWIKKVWGYNPPGKISSFFVPPLWHDEWNLKKLCRTHSSHKIHPWWKCTTISGFQGKKTDQSSNIHDQWNRVYIPAGLAATNNSATGSCSAWTKNQTIMQQNVKQTTTTKVKSSNISVQCETNTLAH